MRQLRAPSRKRSPAIADGALSVQADRIPAASGPRLGPSSYATTSAANGNTNREAVSS